MGKLSHRRESFRPPDNRPAVSTLRDCPLADRVALAVGLEWSFEKSPSDDRCRIEDLSFHVVEFGEPLYLPRCDIVCSKG